MTHGGEAQAAKSVQAQPHSNVRLREPKRRRFGRNPAFFADAIGPRAIAVANRILPSRALESPRRAA
jgi:hypothetical protein